jgi:hypothetical protein
MQIRCPPGGRPVIPIGEPPIARSVNKLNSTRTHACAHMLRPRPGPLAPGWPTDVPHSCWGCRGSGDSHAQEACREASLRSRRHARLRNAAAAGWQPVTRDNTQARPRNCSRIKNGGSVAPEGWHRRPVGSAWRLVSAGAGRWQAAQTRLRLPTRTHTVSPQRRVAGAPPQALRGRLARGLRPPSASPSASPPGAAAACTPAEPAPLSRAPVAAPALADAAAGAAAALLLPPPASVAAASAATARLRLLGGGA